MNRTRIRPRAARTDHLLSFTDQGLFLGVRATGQEPVMQCVWVYDRPVDMDGVRRFHQNIGYGLMGRLIETSPLPFGRHRWVASPGQPLDIDFSAPRPREDLSDWADERVQLPVDPEWGPSWRISVLEMTDGSTAVSLVASHCLLDGIGGVLTILEALVGHRTDYDYPPPGSRSRSRAILADARQTVRGIPELARTVVAVTGLALRHRKDVTRPTPRPAPVAGDSGDVVVPAVTVQVNVEDWDACAASLGGTSYALFAGFAAKLGDHMGRANPETGAVSLLIPLNDRTEGDDRANAALLATIAIDPAPVTTDLSEARTVIRAGLKAVKEEPDEALLALPLIPFIPNVAVNRVADVLLGFGDLPVSCSNLGDLDPVFLRLDGSAADYVFLRGMDRHIPRNVLDRRGGQLTLVSGRVGGKVSISIVAYQPGVANSKPLLRELAASTLAEFGLTAVIF